MYANKCLVGFVSTTNDRVSDQIMTNYQASASTRRPQTDEALSEFICVHADDDYSGENKPKRKQEQQHHLVWHLFKQGLFSSFAILDMSSPLDVYVVCVRLTSFSDSDSKFVLFSRTQKSNHPHDNRVVLTLNCVIFLAKNFCLAFLLSAKYLLDKRHLEISLVAAQSVFVFVLVITFVYKITIRYTNE